MQRIAIIPSVSMRWQEHVIKGRMRNAYKIFPEG
jgi:hypothetical protein